MPDSLNKESRAFFIITERNHLGFFDCFLGFKALAYFSVSSKLTVMWSPALIKIFLKPQRLLCGIYSYFKTEYAVSYGPSLKTSTVFSSKGVSIMFE